MANFIYHEITVKDYYIESESATITGVQVVITENDLHKNIRTEEDVQIDYRQAKEAAADIAELMQKKRSYPQMHDIEGGGKATFIKMPKWYYQT